MEEGKMKQAMMRRQDMAKLASLYSKAMKAMPGSPAQKKIKAQIDQYRKELGMNESTEYLEEATDLYNKGGIQIVRFAAGKGKVGVEITVKKGNSPSEIGGQIVLSDTQFKNLQRALPKLNLRKGLGESLDEGLKDGYIVYKKIGSGINKIKKLATLKSMPKGKMLDKVLDKYNADGVMAMSKALRNKVQVEAVSPAQQAAIAISKKEKGEKPKTECADEKDFKPHMMYDPKTGKGVKANTYADHVKYDKMGYTHEKPEVKESLEEGVGEVLLALNFAMFGAVALTFITAVGMELGVIKGSDSELKTAKNDIARLKRKVQTNKQYKLDSIDKEKLNNALKIVRNAKPTAFQKLKTKLKDLVKKNKTVKESRAYRDAMRGMSARGATKGMARTKKDRDIEATDDDRKAASKNIIMQLRKAADLPTGANVEFDRGKGKVTRDQAKAALARFNALSKPNEKEKFQKSIKSLADIKKLLGR